jgi:hypothetical protein
MGKRVGFPTRIVRMAEDYANGFGVMTTDFAIV